MTPDPVPPSDRARRLGERQIDLVGRLADMGMEIAEGISQQCREGDGERAAIDFPRVARAVRLTIMLQARLSEALEDRDRRTADDAGYAARIQASRRITDAHNRGERVGRIVERIAEAEHDPRDAERLSYETRERLDQEDIHGDLLDRPVSEWVAMICQDLGLSPDWPKLAEEAWALEEITSGVPWPPGRTEPAPPPPNIFPQATQWRSGTRGLQRPADDEAALQAQSP